MTTPVFNRQALYTPQAVETGAADVLSHLSSKLAGFRDQQLKKAEQGLIFRGQREAAGVSDLSQLREGGGIRNQAFNNLVRKNYLLGLNNDIDADLQQKAVEFKDQPDQFKLWADQYKKHAIDTIDPTMRNEALVVFQQTFGRYNTQVTRNAAEKAITDQKGALELNLQKSEDAILTSAAIMDENSYSTMMGEYQSLIADAVDSGLMDISTAEGKIHALTKKADAATIVGAMDEAISQGRGLQYVNNVIEAKEIKGFTPEEKQKLEATMLQRLSRRAEVTNKQAAITEAEQKNRYAQGEAMATDLMINGLLDIETLDYMRQHDVVSPELARKLNSSIKRGGVQYDNPDVLMWTEVYLDTMSMGDILMSTELTNETKTRLAKQWKENNETWRADPSVKDGVRRINVKLGLPEPGTISATTASSELMRLAGDTVSEYYDTLMKLPIEERGMKALATAQEIINVNLIGKAKERLSDAEHKLGLAEETLNAARAAGDRAKVERYTREVERRKRQAAEAQATLSEIGA